jgi:hypothetical protein
MKNSEKDLVAEKKIAEAKAFEAKAKVAQANAQVKKTKTELDTVSGVADARQRVKEGIANVKAFAAADLAQTKADFKRANDRLAAWDAAATRDFDARLDAADAQLAAWKAQVDVDRAEDRIARHDDFATLEEKIALARGRAAEAKLEKYTTKAQVALGDAARAFDQAYDAAASRYNKET